MIRLLLHNEIDFKLWDNCIEQSPNGMIYAYSWYLNKVAPGWQALVEGNYQTVMPLPVKKKMGVTYVYQPFFVQQLGVFGMNSHQSDVCDRFVDEAIKRFRWIDYNLNTHNVLHRMTKFGSTMGVTHHLDLIEPYSQLRARYSENTRRNIAKANKKGVFVLKNGSPDEVIGAFRTHKGKALGVFGQQDFRLLSQLIFSAIQRGFAQVYSAYTDKNTFCGGIVLLQSHYKAVLIFSGSTAEAMENGAMFALIDDFIKQNAGSEYMLDFEGSTDVNLARFYKGFGSKECVFLRIKSNRLPPIAEMLLRTIRTVRKIFIKTIS